MHPNRFSTLRLLGALVFVVTAIPILYPAIMREICYWLLTGPHGGEVMRMTLANSHAQRVISAVHTLRDRFAEPIRIDELASIATMSPSAFHRQFKAITAMTPLQLSEAAPFARSAPIDRNGGDECRDGRVSGWLRKSVPVQPRVFPNVRSAAAA
jgi:hypothetical protein